MYWGSGVLLTLVLDGRVFTDSMYANGTEIVELYSYNPNDIVQYAYTMAILLVCYRYEAKRKQNKNKKKINT